MNNNKLSVFRKNVSSGPGLFMTFIAAMFYLSFYTSCANIGTPEGGDKDSIPPEVLRTVPSQNKLNVKPKQIEIVFDEYIQLDGLSEKLVISPPLEKRPISRMRGKSLVLKFQEELKDSTTYSIDFKNSIADYNEKNVLNDYRIGFSTGPTIDTLRIFGFVKDAFNLEVVEGSYVFLYENLSDTVVTTTKPDYIAKTNEQGFFMFTGLPQKEYKIYVVDDSNNDLKLDPRSEFHAFLDSTLYPTATFLPDSNLQVSGDDTLLIYGHVRFQPDPVYLLQYEQQVNLQTLDDYKREERKRIQFIFTEEVSEDFAMTPVNFSSEEEEWYYLEASENRDTLEYWITDTLVSNLDTLEMSVKYLEPDSLFNMVERIDTLEFLFEDPVVQDKKKRVKGLRKQKNVEKKVETISLSSNIKKQFDIYRKVELLSPDPINDIPLDSVRLTYLVDTVFEAVDFKFYRDSTSKRRFFVEHNWIPEGEYKLSIDSASTYSIYGVPMNRVDQRFSIQKEGYYGNLKISLLNVDGPIIVQLLKDSEEEEVVYEKFTSKDEMLEFPFLAPQKLKMKVIYDRNNNGVWDTGNIGNNVQPESVVYWDKIIRIRSNFDNVESWRLPREFEYKKDIFDPEAEAEKAKKEKQKARTNMKAF